MTVDSQELAAWRKSERDKLAAQLRILRLKVRQGKGWPGIEEEIEAKEAEYRAHIMCLGLEEHDE